MTLGQQPRPPVPQAGAGAHLVGPAGRDDQDRQPLGPAGKGREDLEAEVIGPMEVLEPEEFRTGSGVADRVDDVEDEQSPAPPDLDRHVHLGVGQPIEQRSTERRQIRQAADGASEIEDGGGRHILVPRGEHADRDLEARIRRAPLDRTEQARPADARVAGQQERLPAPIDDVGKAGPRRERGARPGRRGSGRRANRSWTCRKV